jgi:hypothetical protein
MMVEMLNRLVLWDIDGTLTVSGVSTQALAIAFERTTGQPMQVRYVRTDRSRDLQPPRSQPIVPAVISACSPRPKQLPIASLRVICWCAVEYFPVVVRRTRLGSNDIRRSSRLSEPSAPVGGHARYPHVSKHCLTRS